MKIKKLSMNVDEVLEEWTAKYTWMGNLANIALYLENGTRYGHRYYRTPIGSHRQPIDLE